MRALRRPLRLYQRNLLVYKHSWMVIVSGFFEPLFYLLSLGLGLGGMVSEVDGLSYAAFVAPGLLASSCMNGAVSDGLFNIWFKLHYQKTYDGILATPLGVVDVAMDPKNPLVLYAATYEKTRRPYSFGPGGTGSGLYKTMDAGKTWTRLEGGLPTGTLGRIGISISRQDPNTVYAIVEVVKGTTDEEKKKLAMGFGDTVNDPLFRSDDAGRTWKQVAPQPAPAASASPKINSP